jgi:hypothetical protein
MNAHVKCYYIFPVALQTAISKCMRIFYFLGVKYWKQRNRAASMAKEHKISLCTVRCRVPLIWKCGLSDGYFKRYGILRKGLRLH